jgi:hypothetical protein
MLRRLLATDDSTATATLRLVLGVVFFAQLLQENLVKAVDGGCTPTRSPRQRKPDYALMKAWRRSDAGSLELSHSMLLSRHRRLL